MEARSMESVRDSFRRGFYIGLMKGELTRKRLGCALLAEGMREERLDMEACTQGMIDGARGDRWRLDQK